MRTTLPAFVPALLIASTAMAQTLSPADAAAGWIHYSGDHGAALWRGYKKPSFPEKGWTLADNTLRITKGSGGGDIITSATFADAEMAFDFKLGEKSNSGIMYRVSEAHGAPWMTGPEFQILDDATFNTAPTHVHSVGAMYDLYAPSDAKTANPAGQWNSARIRIRTGVLQHWLNGKKIVEARLFNDDGSPTAEWAEKIKNSKFNAYAGFGVLPSGHIAIQDHGDSDAAYRNIMIRDLAAPLPGEVVLFNGKDLTGWTAYVPELADAKKDPRSVWSVADGVLICAGNPVGYIRTDAKYTNFILRLEWRFSPVTKKAGNSGVLFRMVGEDAVWPKSIEAQLHSGNAGDFWNIGDFGMTTDPARTNGRNTRKTHNAERPVGEWNEYEIIVNKGDVILMVNGEELNRATGADEVAGHICLQSEGAEIHFRNIRLTELK